MDEDDDDFYGGGGLSAQQGDAGLPPQEFKEEQMDVGEDHEDEEEEEEDSDDDVQFTLEKPADAVKPEHTPEPRTTRSQATTQEKAASSDAKVARSSTPIKHEQRSGPSAPPVAALKGTLTYNGKEGKDFPEIRTSKIDVEAIPVWPANGKPIIEVDLDADLAENSKLWRVPGTDQTDFFNYGFDEYTWAQYCLRQQTMSNTISDQKQADAQMKAMFGGGGMGNGASASMPSGIPPGMPGPEEFMAMMASGGNPNDPQFFEMMMNNVMGGMTGGQGPGQQNQQAGGGNFGQQGGGGFRGPNQNTGSPHPQSGQGFQPPTGPANQHGPGGGQADLQANMDGYSPQQIAIMQQQQQGGGGRGRGRRGRGYNY